MRLSTISAIVLIAMLGTVDARVCKPTSGDGYKEYRLIDGRKCWFKGKRPEKSELHWEHISERVAVRRHPRSPPSVKPGAVRWPEVAPTGLPNGPGSKPSFDSTWEQMMDDLIGNHMEEYRAR
jgi:hypothetical protein